MVLIIDLEDVDGDAERVERHPSLIVAEDVEVAADAPRPFAERGESLPSFVFDSCASLQHLAFCFEAFPLLTEEAQRIAHRGSSILVVQRQDRGCCIPLLHDHVREQAIDRSTLSLYRLTAVVLLSFDLLRDHVGIGQYATDKIPDRFVERSRRDRDFPAVEISTDVAFLVVPARGASLLGRGRTKRVSAVPTANIARSQEIPLGVRIVPDRVLLVDREAPLDSGELFLADDCRGDVRQDDQLVVARRPAAIRLTARRAFPASLERGISARIARIAENAMDHDALHV